MSRLQALIPALVFYPALFLLALVLGNALWYRSLGSWRRGAVLFLVAWIALVLLGCAVAPRSWLRLSPEDNRETLAAAQETWETAIVFGFGYIAKPGDPNDTVGSGDTSRKREHILPGPANKALLDWVVEHTVADTLIVQEGVWAAACDTAATECEYQGHRLVRMHPHDPNHYVNTLDASVYALDQLSLLNRKRTLVVAHDLQLARALMAMRRVAAALPAATRTELVAPDLPPIPFVPGGAHLQTSHAWLYKPIELLVARPRDALWPVPRTCGSPPSS